MARLAPQNAASVAGLLRKSAPDHPELAGLQAMLAASDLNSRGLATLLFDLLDDAEAVDHREVFDVGLLARRLLHATGWVASQPDLASLPLGVFGASAGAAAPWRRR